MLAVLALYGASDAIAARCGDNPGAYALITELRAQAEAVCPCASATDGRSYYACFKLVVADAVLAGRFPRSCRSTLLKTAKRSTCGRPGAVTCCTAYATKTLCRVRTSDASCLGVASSSIGSTESCDAACGPTCGNRLIEPGEECDDGNRLSGDGCSATCRQELPGGCVAITEADYRAAYANDPVFAEVLEHAKALGYSTSLVSPVRCETPGSAPTYVAFLPHPLDPYGAILRSDPDALEALSTVAYRGNSAMYETLLATGTIRYTYTPGTDAPVIERLDLSGNVIPTGPTTAPILDSPTCRDLAWENMKCIAGVWGDEATDPYCVACSACVARCLATSDPRAIAVCLLTCAPPCSSCRSNHQGCPIRRDCVDGRCRRGECRFWPVPYCVGDGGNACDQYCQECEIHEPVGRCVDVCSECSVCRQGVCTDLNAGCTQVAGRVTGDVPYPGGCFYSITCDAVTGVQGCASSWGFSVGYVGCNATGGGSCMRAIGSVGVSPPQTCGYSCVRPTPCDPYKLRNPAIENAYSTGKPRLPDPNDPRWQWVIPPEKRQCCPAVQSLVDPFH
jgi:cysteine-rich repeat protein